MTSRRGQGIIDLTGQRFARLVVQERGEDYFAPEASATQGRVRWLCRCDCGGSVLTSGVDLRNGHTRSCGCLIRDVTAERSTTHGHAPRSGQHPLYAVWRTMNTRCTNPNFPTFEHYGARGITVCDRWRGPQGFANFLTDMGERPAGRSPGGRSIYSIDRIDNDGPYSPENCRWATQSEQMSNRGRVS